MNERPIAAITGAAQGIGHRLAEALAERGYRVALNDLRMPDETIRSIQSQGGEAIGFAGNIADESTVEGFVRCVYGAWGRTDVLVNNAGISFISPAESISGEDYRRVLEVNLVAPFLLAKAFGTRMLAARHGCIINVASIAGLVGIADRAAYNVSKHGLIGLTRTLAAEWGGRGVRVNAVCPGWVKTEMDSADQAGGSYTDADITGRVPMGRFATPILHLRLRFSRTKPRAALSTGTRLQWMAAGPRTEAGSLCGGAIVEGTWLSNIGRRTMPKSELQPDALTWTS